MSGAQEDLSFAFNPALYAYVGDTWEGPLLDSRRWSDWRLEAVDLWPPWERTVFTETGNRTLFATGGGTAQVDGLSVPGEEAYANELVFCLLIGTRATWPSCLDISPTIKQ
jgi:hypothetical protein